MPDKFAYQAPSLLSAAETAEFFASVSANVQFKNTSREITVGTVGDLNLQMADGTTLLVPSVIWTAQSSHALRATGIVSSGTTASNILVKE